MIKTKTAPASATSIIFNDVKTKIFKIKYASLKNLTDIDREFLKDNSDYCEEHLNDSNDTTYIININSLEYMPLFCIRDNANIELVKFIDNVRLEQAGYTHVEFYTSNDVES